MYPKCVTQCVNDLNSANSIQISIENEGISISLHYTFFTPKETLDHVLPEWAKSIYTASETLSFTIVDIDIFKHEAPELFQELWDVTALERNSKTLIHEKQHEIERLEREIRMISSEPCRLYESKTWFSILV